ncbi:uncharacterized protein LOC6567657 [Drosophila grimshawi]|uniref:GH17823 n=1 Tax=Drosophila grimshawi TaxID=7222 RepID=B4JSM9_DROGR|nr:uncharacterized protein LOC6567657 [Drosophila grimshawi]EDV94769.1 GH17823 [Drosophila grimshawi]
MGIAPSLPKRGCPCPRRCHPECDIRHGAYRSRHGFIYRTPALAKCQPRCGRSNTEVVCRPAGRTPLRQVPRYSNTDIDYCCCPTPAPSAPPVRQMRSSSSINCCFRPPESKKPHSCRINECQGARYGPMRQLPPVALPLPSRWTPPSQNLSSVPIPDEIPDEPCDPYYNYDRNQPQAVNTLANFDLNRFDRDSAGHARRRNVSIRSYVDYDYDAGNHVNTHPPFAQDSLMPAHLIPCPYQNQPAQRNLYPSHQLDHMPHSSRQNDFSYIPHAFRR